MYSICMDINQGHCLDGVMNERDFDEDKKS